MKHFIVEYTLPYEHVVRVGVKAPNATAAEAAAQAAFDRCDIWDNAPHMPLLYDDYEEVDGQALSFKATEVPSWPAADASVVTMRRHDASYKMVTLLWALVDGTRDLASLKNEARALLVTL